LNTGWPNAQTAYSPCSTAFQDHILCICLYWLRFEGEDRKETCDAGELVYQLLQMAGIGSALAQHFHHSVTNEKEVAHPPIRLLIQRVSNGTQQQRPQSRATGHRRTTDTVYKTIKRREIEDLVLFLKVLVDATEDERAQPTVIEAAAQQSRENDSCLSLDPFNLQ
jgi:hypothetical protein